MLKFPYLFLLNTLLGGVAVWATAINKPIVDNARQKIGVLDIAPPTKCQINPPAVTVFEGTPVNLNFSADPAGWTKNTTFLGPQTTQLAYPRQVNPPIGKHIYTGSATGMFNTATCQTVVTVKQPPPPPCKYEDPKNCEPMNTAIGYVNVGIGCPKGPGNVETNPMPANWCMVAADGYAPCLIIIRAPCWPNGSHCPAFTARLMNPGTPGCYLAMPYHVRMESCFAPETRIRMADGSWKRVTEVNGGDQVFNPVTGKTMKVSGLISGPEKYPLYVVSFGEKKLRVTRTHPFLTDAGPKQARELKLGDKVMTEAGDFRAITVLKKSYLKKGESVYNFRFHTHHSPKPDDHWIVAEGMVVSDYTLQNILDNRVPEHFDISMVPYGGSDGE